MKKLLVVIAVLSLIAGTAYAADLNEGLTKQVYAQAKGRSVVSDDSIALRVWYYGPNTPLIAVSGNTIALFENGVETDVNAATYPTPQRMTDYINSLTYWKAAVGPDAIPGQLITQAGGVPSGIMFRTATQTSPGSNTAPTNVYMDTSTSRQLNAGIGAMDGKYNRIKSIQANLAVSVPGIVSLLIYDGDTLVWRKDLTTTQFYTATGKDASPMSVTFVDKTDKGISGGLGKSLVAIVSGSSAVCTTEASLTSKLFDHNISIVYDQF